MIRKFLVFGLVSASLLTTNSVFADAYYPALKSSAKRSSVVAPVASSLNEEMLETLKTQVSDLEMKLQTSSNESKAFRQDLDMQMGMVRQSLDSLRTQNMGVQSDIHSLNTKVAALIAENEKRKNNVELEQLISPVFTAPVGTLMGAVRGAAAKSTDHTKDFYDALGGGVFGTMAAPVGFFSGAVSGLLTGTAKGFIDGVVFGVEEPFSLKSISLEGKKYLDFDSYDIL